MDETSSGRRYQTNDVLDQVWIELAGDEVEHGTSVDMPAFTVRLSIEDLREIVRERDMRARGRYLERYGRGGLDA
jgi:hypothetical protein